MSDIHFVGGEKGGVGKSVIARLLTQYFIDHARSFKALDADASHGALLRFYADYSKAISLQNSDDTDQIMQLAVEENQTVLVDLPSQSKKSLNDWLSENEILTLAQENNVNVVFWHVMDDSVDASNLLLDTMNHASNLAKYVIVKNYGRGEDFSQFEGSVLEQEAINRGAQIISINALQSATMRKIDRLNCSFWAAANNSNSRASECLGLMERQRVKSWLKNSYQQIAQALNATKQRENQVTISEVQTIVRPYLTSV